jgi:hypothetical protein
MPSNDLLGLINPTNLVNVCIRRWNCAQNWITTKAPPADRNSARLGWGTQHYSITTFSVTSTFASADGGQPSTIIGDNKFNVQYYWLNKDPCPHWNVDLKLLFVPCCTDTRASEPYCRPSAAIYIPGRQSMGPNYIPFNYFSHDHHFRKESSQRFAADAFRKFDRGQCCHADSCLWVEEAHLLVSTTKFTYIFNHQKTRQWQGDSGIN